jgi:hypothetical protein
MHAAGTDHAEPPDPKKLVPRLFWLWMGGMGFGGHLILLIMNPRAAAPVYLALILVAVAVTFFSALGTLRLFNEALTYRGDTAPEIEVPEII